MSEMSEAGMRRMMADYEAGMPYTDLQIVSDPGNPHGIYITAMVFPGREEEARLMIEAHTQQIRDSLKAKQERLEALGGGLWGGEP